MGRRKYSVGKKRWLKEQREDAKGHDFKRVGESWVATTSRIPCRILSTTRDALRHFAQTNRTSTRAILDTIGQQRLRRHARVVRFSDQTERPYIQTRGDFKPASRRRVRPHINKELVRINPKLSSTAKAAFKFESEATGLTVGQVIDRWVSEFLHFREVAEKQKGALE